MKNIDKVGLPSEKRHISSFVKTLGSSTETGNEYSIKADNGVFWIFHNVVGSGEPLQQAIEHSLEGEIISMVHQMRYVQKEYFALRKAEGTRWQTKNSKEVLALSKKLEAELDLLLKQYYKEVGDGDE